MNKEFLPKDDSHPLQLTSADIILRQQLENSISSYFFNACDRTIQNLLSSCRWYILSHANALTLVVECPDQITNWRVLQKIVPMAAILGDIISSAKIRICPPKKEGMPFEMRVDELSVYRDMA
ncbi:MULTISPECIES: hypothetical protein [Fischerella]|jgi:hypothetical protein|uniref:Uncharacterized protein n=1 Tax=Fischerella muscicola CCMEE 5323 TaxID=2019572 RepID=A0A2N6K8N5_FISMU|nr:MULTISPECIES: hypothetical protein [Fischerella]MBD2433651.1 hypothetical protein [Fischerella sp. FACHB-380]PLZ94051.1 hypothetical protein CEN44_01540 [Fischerella muscicola CCMEE 5323]